MNDQQAAEYMAGIESVMQAARWTFPVDLAIDACADPLVSDGFPISGDHRPRHGRLYARGERVDSAHE